MDVLCKATQESYEFKLNNGQVLNRDTIVDLHPLNRGGFSTVTKITLEDGSEIVCKAHQHNLGEGLVANERDNLEILASLNHPNIVKFLGYHAYNGEHLFFFSLAQNGDMARLLSSDELPPHLVSELSLYTALLGLSSALHSMHDYHCGDVHLVGCQRDFRPPNILVHGTEFLLSDFGFSEFKPAGQKSESVFQIGTGMYLAPECKDKTGRPGEVGQPGDIWAFGCIITVLLTHMLHGKKGVEAFQGARETYEGRYIPPNFHGESLEAVRDWLAALEPRLSSHGQEVLRLAKDMMALEPDGRPRAAEVHRRLAGIVQEASRSSKL